MDVSIGLPAAPRPGERDHVLAWAARADAGPFRSLAAGDRMASRGHEAFVALAAAAGATSRIGLMASLVVGPARDTVLLVRQTASLDALSGGRLTLGLGVGARADDYASAPIPFERRGRAFDEQLPTLRALLGGDAAARAGPVGRPPVRPGGPPLLIGGYVPATADRIARWGDGFMAPGASEPDELAGRWRAVLAAWAAADREGQPRFVGGSYVSLGPGADDAARRYIEAYYAYDPALAARRLRAIPTSAAALGDRISAFAAIGVDELMLRPVEADPAFVGRLEDALTGG
jgi:alkanesulfonate monooxygenase SsuD/methylene tetrahydromethanopterin reductase-like flavin-dependent oxidoreductase (luciferase family)